MKLEKAKYFYVGMVDGYALESGCNVTRLRDKLLSYEKAERLSIRVYRLCGNTMLPVSIRHIKGGEL